jgi:hypothetical protein
MGLTTKYGNPSGMKIVIVGHKSGHPPYRERKLRSGGPVTLLVPDDHGKLAVSKVIKHPPKPIWDPTAENHRGLHHPNPPRTRNCPKGWR